MVDGDSKDYFGMSGMTMEQLRKEGYLPFTPLEERDSFISEGDTPTFMNLLDSGLRTDRQPVGWLGWYLEQRRFD